MHQLTEKEYKDLFAATWRYVKEHSGSRQDAENLLQHVLTKLYAGQLAYQETGRMGGFVIRAVKAAWIDELRLRKRGKTSLGDDAFNLNQGEKIDLEGDIDYKNHLQHADLSNDVQAAAAALFQNPNLFNKYQIYVQWKDTACRKRLELAYIEGVPNKVIAAMESEAEGKIIPENTFNKRLSDCCKKFIKLCNGLRKR
jgi:DNA-directed RNA polymerase specialized sigma24 family protein